MEGRHSNTHLFVGEFWYILGDTRLVFTHDKRHSKNVEIEPCDLILWFPSRFFLKYKLFFFPTSFLIIFKEVEWSFLCNFSQAGEGLNSYNSDSKLRNIPEGPHRVYTTGWVPATKSILRYTDYDRDYTEQCLRLHNY